MTRKKWTVNIWMVLSVTLVSACNFGEDTDLSKEEVIEQTITNAEEVDSYTAELEMDVEGDALDISHSNISYVVDVHEPSETMYYDLDYIDEMKIYNIGGGNVCK